MDLSKSVLYIFRASMLAFVVLSSQFVSAEQFEFQFADLTSSWANARVHRANYKVILSDVKGTDKFTLTIKTTYDQTVEDVYKNLKLKNYSNEENKQRITFEDENQYFTFINVSENSAGKEFFIVPKDKDLPFFVYSNSTFYLEDPQAAHSLQLRFFLIYRNLVEYIQKNCKVQKKQQTAPQSKKTTSPKPKNSSASTQKIDVDYDAWCASNYLKNPMSYTDYPLDPDGFYSFVKGKYPKSRMGLNGSESFGFFSHKDVDFIFGKGVEFTYLFYRDKERWSYRISFDNVSQATDFVTKTMIPRLAKQENIKFNPVKVSGSIILSRYKGVYSGNDITVEARKYSNTDCYVYINVSRELRGLDESFPSLVRQVDINGLLTHPFGLKDNTLNSSFDSIIEELKKCRYAVSEINHLTERELSTPSFSHFFDDVERCAPIVVLPLPGANNLIDNLSSDDYVLLNDSHTITYRMSLKPGCTFENDAIQTSKLYKLSPKERGKLVKKAFEIFVDMLKRDGFSMKKINKNKNAISKYSSLEQAYKGKKGDLTVTVGLSPYNSIDLFVEKAIAQ